jgi:anaphase-promoting complex subunit 6
LGHAYRRLRQFNKALDVFNDVLRLGGKDAAIFSAKGLILMEQNRPEEAVAVLHQALAISPQDSIATELLNKALEETVFADAAAEEEAEEADEFAAFESHLDQKKLEAAQRVNGHRPGRGMLEKGKGRVTRRRTLLDDEEKGQSMMEMTDDDA